jgi:arabinofuranan 3-O-arabinosyltransferase
MTERSPGRVSFVIPTRNNARTIGACVASAAGQPGDVEVVVVDNHSTDGTASLAGRAGAGLVCLAGPERSAQRNRGFERSSGEIVVFIDSDMVLDPGLADAVRHCFADPKVCGAVLPERAFGDGYLAASRALELRLAMGDPGFEDYELADRVAGAGVIGRCQAGVGHDEGRVHLVELARKKHYYGTQWLTGRAGLGGRRTWRRSMRPAVLIDDIAHVPGLVILKLVDNFGLAAGAAHAVMRHRLAPLAGRTGST